MFPAGKDPIERINEELRQYRFLGWMLIGMAGVVLGLLVWWWLK
jgi:hypothetical protein